MDLLTQTEINTTRGEAEEIRISLDGGKNQFAKELLNGLGDEIENDLKNPVAVTKKAKRKAKKFSLKLKVENIKDNLYRMFILNGTKD